MWNEITKEILNPDPKDRDKNTVEFDVMQEKGKSHEFILYSFDYKCSGGDFWSFGNCANMNIIKAAIDLREKMLDTIREAEPDEREALITLLTELDKDAMVKRQIKYGPKRSAGNNRPFGKVFP